MKKVLSIILSVVLLAGTCIVYAVSANAENAEYATTSYNLLSENEFASRISALKAMYPEKSQPDYTYYENGTALAWTCKGFANKLAYYCFGSSQYTWNNGGWSKSWDSSYFNAGDIVSVNNDSHTIFITYVNGNTIRYAEGNHSHWEEGYYSAVRWDVETTLSELQGRFYYKHHLNGNNLTGGGSGGNYGLDYGNDFYALIINSSGWKHLGQTDSGNVAIMNNTSDNENRVIWHFVKINSNNAYRIMSVYNGKYLDVSNADDKDGANLQCWSYHDNPAQEWYIQSPDGNLYLTAGCTSRVIDVQNGNPSIGTNVYMWSRNGTDAQKLSIYRLEDKQKVGNSYGEDFYALIKQKTSKKVLGQNTSGNVELMSESAKNYDKTIWHFTRQNNRNTYRISSVYNNKYLDVYYAGDSDGQNIQCWSYNDNPAQEWYIQTRRNCTALTPGCAVRYLDLSNGSTDDGTNAQLWEFNNSGAQDYDISIISENEIVDYAISSNKERFDSGESVNLTVSGSLPYVYNYKFHIVKPDGTESVIDNNCNSALIYQPDADGEYFVYAEVKNPYHTDIGMTSDKAVIFTVGEEPRVPPTEGRKSFLGDADGDGEVTSVDATYIQRYNAMLKTGIDEETLMCGDVDGNGLLEIIDATFIQRHLAHMETPYRIAQLIE